MFTGKHAESQSGWTAFGIIVMLLGILTAWTAFGTKESTTTLRAKAEDNGGPKFLRIPTARSISSLRAWARAAPLRASANT